MFVIVWWCGVSGLVDVHGCSWCSHCVVGGGGVVIVGHHGHSFMMFNCHLLLWVM